MYKDGTLKILLEKKETRTKSNRAEQKALVKEDFSFGRR